MQLIHSVRSGLLIAVALCLAGGASAQTLVDIDITAALPEVGAGVDRIWGDNDDGPNECPIILRGPVFVLQTSLTIVPGCVIRGEPRTADFDPMDALVGFPGTLIIARDAFLNAQGGPDNPIVFTTAAVDNDNDGVPDDDDVDGRPDPWSPGDIFLDDTPLTNPLSPLLSDGTEAYGLHGGLVLIGRSPNNLDDRDGLGYGLARCEGLPIPGVDPDGATYGGYQPHDSSGIISYFSVRHAGDEIAPNDELNGITLCGVGDGTIFEYVDAYANGDDGFEMFGGTANLRHVVVAYAGDDSLDVDQGYTGTIQFALTLSDFFNQNDGSDVGTGNSGDAAGEFDGDDCPDCNVQQDIDSADTANFSFPSTNAVVCNWTHVGNQPDAGVTNPAVSDAAPNQGIEADTNWNGVICNSIIINQGALPGVEMDPATGGSDDNLNRYIVASTTADSGGWEDQALATDACTAAQRGDAQVAAGQEYQGGSDNVPDPDVACEPGPAVQLLTNENHYFLPTGVAVNGRGKLAGSKTNAAGTVGAGAPFDPRPASPNDANVSGGIQPHWPGFDRSATYRGAFSAAEQTLWCNPWSTLAIGGLIQ